MHEFTDLIDVASERLGGAVLLANDEFFAPKERLLLSRLPEWRDDAYTEHGKWMDGWETRRRRDPGHDWCIVRLGVPAIVRGIVVDTAYFRGNHPESCSLDACDAPDGIAADALVDPNRTQWSEILTRQPLEGDRRNPFAVAQAPRAMYLRFNIFPDGGVARLRVHGDVIPDPRLVCPGREVDLAAMEHGGFVVACSDMFYGHRQNLILPGRATHMGDGWETRRRRGPGHEWTMVRLAARGVVTRIELDTDHFKGNAPESCWLDRIDAPGAAVEELTGGGGGWSPLVTRTTLQPHTRHLLMPPSGHRAGIASTHIRLNIFPDGGVARLRLFGEVTT
jgi:allantoicase